MGGETKNWANWARAIGIFLVILGHVVLKQETLKTVIYCFHMPLFFLLSGYLDSHGKPFAEDVRKNAKGLLLPYLMFAALTYLPWLIVQFPRHPQDYPDRTVIGWALKPLLGVLFGVGYNTPYSYAHNAPLWFLVCLFWLKTMYSAAAALCRKRALWALPLGAGLIAVLFSVKLSGIDLYLSLDSALMALPFYVLGAWLRSAGYPEKFIKRAWPNAPLFLAFAAATALIAFLNGRVDINGFAFGKNAALFYLGGVTGSLMTISLCLLLDPLRLKLVGWISETTLVALSLHSLFLGAAVALVAKAFGSGQAPYGTPESLLASAIVLAACVAAGLFIRRYLPFLIAKGSSRKREA